MMLFNSEITILVLVDDNSSLASTNVLKNHAFANACRAKWPSHHSHEANCLWLFLAHV